MLLHGVSYISISLFHNSYLKETNKMANITPLPLSSYISVIAGSTLYQLSYRTDCNLCENEEYFSTILLISVYPKNPPNAAVNHSSNIA
jgi:hypothetical protein